MTPSEPSATASTRSAEDQPSPALEGFGLVGDTETVAIIHQTGSIDWMCWPRFDSPSVFGRLLDPDGGHWSIGPTPSRRSRHDIIDDARHDIIDDAVDDGRGVESKQVYLSGTNVLLTRFHTPTGTFEVEDFMSIDTVDDHPRHLMRVVRCRKGSVEVTSTLRLRPDYGRADATVERRTDQGRRADRAVSAVALHSPGATNEAGAHEPDLTLSSSVDLEVDQDATVTSTFTLAEDDTAYFALGDGDVSDAACQHSYRRTLAYWRTWSAASTYTGRWREHVERSALTLKLLTHRPSGGIIAAATTSIPEVRGGERNWDYRYVWIRDAAFTLYAFIELGYLAEADAFTSWLVERVRTCDESGDRPPLSPMYDLDGAERVDEVELDHWQGYAHSSPVRVGNAAGAQLQLDIYGEMIDALYLADKHGDGLSIDTWKHICVLVEWVIDNWTRPDEGIWETRGGEQHHTSSRLMCWVALERALRMARRRGRPAPVDRWRTARDAIHACIVEDGWNDELAAFTQTLGGSTLDASMLLMPLVKFISPTDERWLSTLDAIGERLSHGPLVDRYDVADTDDGLEGDEGSFTICSFWYAEALARSGRVDEARSLFDRLLSYGSPTGVFSEEIGPDGRMIGNFPQAFTHLSLISAAVHLDELLP